MWRKFWIPIANHFTNPWIRGGVLTLYYLAIILGLIIIYAKGDFSTPAFVYQGF